jgi:hypothetical protein
METSRRFQKVFDILKLEQTCKICPFSLVCLSGKHFRDPGLYYCDTCEGVWIDSIKTLVKCDAFNWGAAIDILPGCPYDEPFEEDPEEVTVIEGYRAEETREIHDPDAD